MEEEGKAAAPPGPLINAPKPGIFAIAPTVGS